MAGLRPLVVGRLQAHVGFMPDGSCDSCRRGDHVRCSAPGCLCAAHSHEWTSGVSPLDEQRLQVAQLSTDEERAARRWTYFIIAVAIIVGIVAVVAWLYGAMQGMDTS
jgi:hypothetical protein